MTLEMLDNVTKSAERSGYDLQSSGLHSNVWYSNILTLLLCQQKIEVKFHSTRLSWVTKIAMSQIFPRLHVHVYRYQFINCNQTLSNTVILKWKQ